jgi:hypothetical protein
MFRRTHKPAPSEPVRALRRMRAITDRLVRRERSKRRKLSELGIEYDFPGYAAGRADDDASPDADANRIGTESAAKQARNPTDAAVDVSSASKSRRKDSLSSAEPEDGLGSSKKAHKKKRKGGDASREAGGGDKDRARPESGNVSRSSDAKKGSRKEGDSGLERENPVGGDVASPQRSRKDSTSSLENESSGKKKKKSKRKDSDGSHDAEKSSLVDDSLRTQQLTKPVDRMSKESERKEADASAANQGRASAPLPAGDLSERRRPKSEKKKKKEKKKEKERRASVP